MLLGVARPCAEVGKEISRREGWEKVKQLVVCQHILRVSKALLVSASASSAGPCGRLEGCS